MAFALLMPLIGIMLVEHGEYAGTIGIEGFPSGATLAFSCYVVLLTLCGLFAGRVGLNRPVPSAPFHSEAMSGIVVAAGYRLFLFQFGFVLLFLFGFGAINVWVSSMPKGELRVSLGSFSLIPNLMTKLVIPFLLAYLVLLYQRSKQGRRETVLLLMNLALALFVGMSWGFKTTGLLMLTPAALLYFWSVSFRKVFGLGIVVFSMLYLNFYIFDAIHETHVDGQVLDFIVRRLTILQGDVAWHMWTLYRDGDEFLPYAPTFLAAFGDTALQSFIGISRNDEYQWMLTHYDWMITFLAGSSLEQIAGGHSIVGTPFSEGLIAGGYLGVGVFAVIAGLVAGLNYRILHFGLLNGRTLLAALAATYFVFHTFPWLIGGAIVQLFHPSIGIGVFVALVSARVIFSRPALPTSLPVTVARFS